MDFKKILMWLKNHNIYSLKFYKTKPRLKRWLAIFITSFVSFFLVIAIAVSIIASSLLGAIDRPDAPLDIDTPDSAEQVYGDKQLINIMLFGIDSRSKTEISRSDSIMLVTIDKKNCKIKMTSFARDTYVDIPGYYKDKLNHAFAFGWKKAGDISGGAELSLNTMNNAFNLNVTDYATANFWALAHIIDYVGGVDIDVDSAERYDINTNYIPYIQQMGIDCELIKKSGMQHLTGGQALAYCRVRHVGGDIQRGERHREVLMQVFEQVKDMSATKYTGLINLILKECTTSLSNSDILSLGTWAMSNIGSLQFESLGIPTEDLDNGTQIDGIWYNVYDLDKAAKKIEEFIIED